MAFLVFTLVLLSSRGNRYSLLNHKRTGILIVKKRNNSSVTSIIYDGNSGPSHWGNEYKQCIGKFQSPIDIEEKDVTNITFPKLQFSDTENSHVAYMINNGHTVMIRSFDPDLPTISGGPINNTYVFQQLHFHWGQNDNLGSEDLINNHSFSMELHAVFWKKQYGSYDKATEYPDGLTVLGYLYQATDKSNPVFESIVSHILNIAEVDSNITLNDNAVLGKLISPDLALTENYFTYKGSLTTPPCLEIVQWIDFVEPQYLSHEQLAVFRKIQSSDGRNLTHNFRPVQPLDGRIVYRNVPISIISGTTIASTDSKQTTNSSKKLKPTKQSNEEDSHKEDGHNGQQSMWTVSPFGVILGLIFLLQYQ